MIIHNDTQRSAHAWQDQVIDWIFDAILRAGENAPATLRPLFDQAYDDLNVSVFADRGRMPDRDALSDRAAPSQSFRWAKGSHLGQRGYR